MYMAESENRRNKDLTQRLFLFLRCIAKHCKTMGPTEKTMPSYQG